MAGAPAGAARPPRPLEDLVGPGWAPALEPVADRIAAMGALLRADLAAGRTFLPAPDRILAALSRPFDDVRVLILGQDPYPTPGHATGLAFSVAPAVRPLPRSLANVFAEYQADLGLPPPSTGDLTPWAERGVLLLNRCLTVAPGRPGSHRGRGWEAITEHVVRALAARRRPLVAVLWGRDAREARPWLRDAPVVEAPHPSPLSAARGFFGSRPFTTVDRLLEGMGADPVDWALP
jgi:uracil-DNA glycosylase